MTISLPTKKVSTMWRIACSARVRIMRAARFCKDAYTKKSSSRSGTSLLFGCDLHPSELNAGLNFESSVLLPTAAAFCPFFPSRMGCNSTVSGVMGGLHKHYSVVQAHVCCRCCHSEDTRSSIVFASFCEQLLLKTWTQDAFVSKHSKSQKITTGW